MNLEDVETPALAVDLDVVERNVRTMAEHARRHGVALRPHAKTHKTPAIQRWLVAHPRVQLHFTPTYSSWLNLVERWFAELTSKWLRRGSHRSVAELEQAIQSWVDTWNQDPRPFVWTKTADEILDTIVHYCQRINTSAH